MDITELQLISPVGRLNFSDDGTVTVTLPDKVQVYQTDPKNITSPVSLKNTIPIKVSPVLMGRKLK